MTSDVATTVVDEVIKFAVPHGLSAGIGLLAGGAGGAVLTRFLKRNPLANVDFKIITEATEVKFRPGPGGAWLLVSVYREFSLKLKEISKKGTYQLRAELKGNSVKGKWDHGCQIILNDTDALRLEYKDEDTVIQAAPCKIGSVDSLRITLNSTETITRGRGFYALMIGNPKEKTTMKWELDGFVTNPPNVKAYASSEDFDLTILRCGVAEPIYESSHQVTYFFTWAEELFK